MTIAQLQQKFLTSSKERIAPEDFFILLAEATRKEKVFLLAHPEYALDRADEILVRDFFKRRARRESVASIIGHKEFYGYDFRVTRDTLIPRPETEQLVELTLNKISNFQFPISKKITIVDIGTGCGNIIISLAKEIEKMYQVLGIKYYALDISNDALLIAKQNAKIHNIDQTITFLQGDLLAPYTEKYFHPDTRLILAANLPYLSEEIYQASGDDVKKFEPRSALMSGRGGLDHYYRLLEEIKNIRARFSSITIFLEISPEQAETLRKHILSHFPALTVDIHKDLAKKERVVEIHIR